MIRNYSEDKKGSWAEGHSRQELHEQRRRGIKQHVRTGKVGVGGTTWQPPRTAIPVVSTAGQEGWLLRLMRWAGVRSTVELYVMPRKLDFALKMTATKALLSGKHCVLSQSPLTRSLKPIPGLVPLLTAKL